MFHHSSSRGELRRCLIDWPKGPEGLDHKPLPLHPGVRSLRHVSEMSRRELEMNNQVKLMCYCHEGMRQRCEEKIAGVVINLIS